MPKLPRPYRFELDYNKACRQLGVIVPPLHPDPAGAIEAVQELHAKSRATLQRRAAPAEAVAQRIGELAGALPEPEAWELVRQLEEFAPAPAAVRRKLSAGILAAKRVEDVDALIAQLGKRHRRA